MPRKLYFRDKGRLSFDAPDSDGPDAADAFFSDPNHPVPYRNRPIPATYGFTGWTNWVVGDQRFVHGRPDVLMFKTEPLSEKVTVTGDVLVNFFDSMTDGDADWIVKQL